jgi:Ca2+-binding EF-hand superfamily protein
VEKKWRLVMKFHVAFVASAAACAVMLGAMSYQSRALAAPTSVLKALDPDNDGTVDLNEAKAAATALFNRLDPDHDGTLDRRELRGRLSAKDIVAADPDKDSTLDKAEFLAIVEKRFKAADPDSDGTLDAKELRTPAGRALLRLLK